MMRCCRKQQTDGTNSVFLHAVCVDNLQLQLYTEKQLPVQIYYISTHKCHPSMIYGIINGLPCKCDIGGK